MVQYQYRVYTRKLYFMSRPNDRGVFHSGNRRVRQQIEHAYFGLLNTIRNRRVPGTRVLIEIKHGIKEPL